MKAKIATMQAIQAFMLVALCFFKAHAWICVSMVCKLCGVNDLLCVAICQLL